MKYEKLKNRFVEVRTKMRGLEMIGVLTEIRGDAITLCPAIPTDLFNKSVLGSTNADEYFKEYIALKKTSIMERENISSVTESIVYNEAFLDKEHIDIS